MEITNYKRRVHLDSGVKDKMKILKWWKDNGSTNPSLYLAVKATLSIPATSVPAERILSLAGFILKKRRSQLKVKNVNKYIFLNRNRAYIPNNSPVLTPSDFDADADADTPVPSQEEDDNE